MLGIFLDIDTVDRGDLDLGELRATLPDWRFLTTSATKTGAQISQADVIVSNKVMLAADTISSASHLKLICIAATGTNNVDLAAARQWGITVCHVRNYATRSVIEHVFNLILCLNRSLPQYLQAVAAGYWQRSAMFCMLDFPIRELAGQTLGIIGYGELGRAVARVAQAFGMQVLVAEHRGSPARPGRTPFTEVLGSADIISIHCPLREETHNLIGRNELMQMQRNAILINTARGGIVNESDLLNALRSGRIAGAAVDVLCEEPPRGDTPLLSASLPNLLVTPHIAWAGSNTRQRLVDEVAANIRAFLAGTPQNVVHD